MKKILSIVLAIMLAILPVSAATGVSDIPFNPEYNYTADYSFSLDLGNAENIYALIDELSLDSTGPLDLKTFISSIFPADANMNLQLDMSSDYKKMKMALTTDDSYSFALNENFSIAIAAKAGVWLNIDLNAEKPIYQIIFHSPANSKYGVMDLFELIPDEESKKQLMTLFDIVFSKEYVDSINSFSKELIAKHADISFSGTSYTIKLDNDAFISIMKECIPFWFSANADSFEKAGIPFDSFDSADLDLSVLDNIKFLGEDGITYKYSFVSGKLSRAETEMDIELDIESFLDQFIGIEWPYEADGVIKLLAKSSIKLSKYNKTSIKFPNITKDNSFNVADVFAPLFDEFDDEEEVYEPDYPYYVAGAHFEDLITINDETYVPLRDLLEYAYEDSINITYNNGVIKADCKYFPEFKSFTLKRDSTVAYLDEKEVSVSKVILKDGKTYVGTSFFEDIFGWEISTFMHDILNNEYYISFYTREF